MNGSQYITPPPDLPMFLYRRYAKSSLQKLIEWAKAEHQARLVFCAEHGYWREFKRLNEEYSPIRVLAEIKGFRRICANLTQEGYNQLSGRERVFIRRAYEFRELLFRGKNSL